MADEMTKMEALTSLQRVKAQYKNIQAKAQVAAKRTTGTLVAVAGGAAAGAIQAKYPTIGDTAIPTDAAVGVLVTAACLFDLAGDQSDHLLPLGQGMLAAAAAAKTKEALLG